MVLVGRSKKALITGADDAVTVELLISDAVDLNNSTWGAATACSIRWRFEVPEQSHPGPARLVRPRARPAGFRTGPTQLREPDDRTGTPAKDPRRGPADA